MKVERRNIKQVELIESREAGQLPVIRGLAAPFNQVCDEPIWGVFYEMISPGAFSRALNDPKTVCIANVQHSDQVLPVARFKGGKGTLSMRETDAGLEIEVVPPNTEDGRALVEALRRGDIDGMSFAFRAIKDNWNGVHNGLPLRILQDVDLYDVAFVTTPAYSGTTASVRSGEMTKAEYRSMVEKSTGISSEERKRKLKLLELQNLGESSVSE